MPTEHDQLTAPARSGKPASVVSRLGPKAQRRRPLIAAVEIENFKGIGRPVRIDLRPITLLFGRNSGGKSTVLHALCYANEILSRGNVDAGKTDLDGDQIDLGGFRNLVHAHDLDRDVRLRFELSLENWQVPLPLVERMVHHDWVEPELVEEFGGWVHSQAKAESVRSGWVELALAWNRLPGGPVLTRYEVGVNEVLFGRIARAGSFENRFNLEFNWAHPLFDPLRPVSLEASRASIAHVSEASDPQTSDWKLHRATANASTTLPDWGRPLPLNDDDLENNDEIPVQGAGSYSFHVSRRWCPASWLASDAVCATNLPHTDMAARCAICAPVPL